MQNHTDIRPDYSDAIARLTIEADYNYKVAADCLNANNGRPTVEQVECAIARLRDYSNFLKVIESFR